LLRCINFLECLNEIRCVSGDALHEQKRSVTCIRHPTQDFVVNISYTNFKKRLAQKQQAILHIHGYPGCGKSQIVLKLAEDFPYVKSEPVFVKHYIDCSDRSDDVVQQLTSLLEMMSAHKLLKKENFQSAISCLERKSAQEFVELLITADVPILIVIEDPPKEQLDLLADLFRSLACTNKIIHIYVTTRFKNDCCYANLPYYITHQIDGLSETEGCELLGLSTSDSVQQQTKDLETAKEIVRNFSGSPMGLRTVKAVCEKMRIKYADYLHIMNNHNPSLTRLIRQDSKRDNPKQHDIFQAMILLLKPKNSGDEPLLWNTVMVLSLFHHGGIPQLLMGRITERCNESKDSQNRDLFFRNTQNMLLSSSLISEFSNFGICKVDGDSYLNTTVTFHRLVFGAVRMFLQENEILLSKLELAVEILTSLVHKDIRKPEDFNFMKKMLPHIRSVLRFVETDGEACDKFVFKQAVSHLYEVKGLLETDQSVTEAENALKKSLNMLWQSSIGNQLDVKYLLQRSEDAGKVAKRVVELCIDAGKNLGSHQRELSRYMSLVLQLKSNEVNFLSSLVTDAKLIQYIKDAAWYSLNIDPDCLDRFRQLEKGVLFLGIDTHCQIFFVERIAAILHTLARVILCDNAEISLEKREKFIWFSEVAVMICVECLRQTNVNLLLLRLTSNSGVGIRLAGLSSFNKAEKKKILFDARSLALRDRKQLQEGDDFYEYGLRKSVQRDFDDMTVLRSIVRIDAKLLSICDEDNLARIADADGYFDELYQAASNNKEWNISSRCVVYCGKFLAAKKQYGRAAGLFLKAFSLKGIKPNDPWVCYNYARAVVCGSLLEEKAKAIAKCSETLKDQEKIASDLCQKLSHQVELLEKL